MDLTRPCENFDTLSSMLAITYCYQTAPSSRKSAHEVAYSSIKYANLTKKQHQVAHIEKFAQIGFGHKNETCSHYDMSFSHWILHFVSHNKNEPDVVRTHRVCGHSYGNFATFKFCNYSKSLLLPNKAQRQFLQNCVKTLSNPHFRT